MLLLNFVRMVIALIGLIVLDAFRVAYELSGLPMLVAAGLTLFLVFTLSELAEQALIAHFNKDEDQQPG